MTRRTITFAEGIEEGVRETQIEMMRREKRDVPFTEAVNWLILRGLVWSAEHGGMSFEEWVELVPQWIRGLDKINVDAFLDSIPVTREGERSSLPKS